MWLIKKGARATDGDTDWQLSSPATRNVTPGTVFGVDRSGKTFVVGRLPGKIENVTLPGVAMAKRVRASVDTYRRFLGFDKSAVKPEADELDSFTFELPDAEAEAISDQDLGEQVDGLLAQLTPIYRADARYFVVRAAISAPSVVHKLTSEQLTKLGIGGMRGAAEVTAVERPFARMTQVALDLGEIRIVKSGLGGGPPTLGVAPVGEPLTWMEDATAPWVTSIVDPIEAAHTKTIVVGRMISLTTSIGIDAGAGELASVGISTEMLANAKIQFKVAVDGATATATLSPELRFEPEAPAVFSFQIQATAPGPVTLRVILYLNGRPTLRQNIELTAVTAEVPAGHPGPAGLQAPPPAGVSTIDGRNLMTLPAPRLGLEIGTYEERYPIELTVDGRRSERPAIPPTSAADLAHKTIDWRRRLVALSEQYGLGAAGELTTATPDAMRAFARIGVEIHRALFGRPKQRGLEDLRRMAEAIAQIQPGGGPRPLVTIAAERLPLPWGIIYDRSLDEATPVDPAGFWGHRFLIERIAPAVLGKIPSRSLRSAGDTVAQLVPCVNVHLDDQQHVAAAANQLEFFKQLGDHGLACRPVVQSRDALEQWLTADRGESRLLYFFCHASSAKTIDDRFFLSRQASDVATWLDLDADDARRIDIGWLANARGEPLAGQPLVFLNACSTAEGDREFQSPFLTQFIREYDCRGLIGSDWKVPTAFADAFSRRFLQRFLDSGANLGEAYVAISNEFVAAGNPFPLIYALYGRTDIVVNEEHS